MRLKRFLMMTAFASIMGIQFSCSNALASNDPTMDAAIVKIKNQWAHIKYEVTDPGIQQKQLAALNKVAHTLALQYPTKPEPLIWDGILESEQASLSGGLTALRDAGTARDILLKALKMNPAALEGGAATSLGVLYNRVPGFPLWGNKNTARKYFQEGLKYGPDSMDSHYFYGDYFYGQGQYPQAAKILTQALTLPHHPETPLWDKTFRVVIQQLLEKVNAKLAK